MTNKSEEEIFSILKKRLANVLDIPKEKITKNRPLVELGMDSFGGLEFNCTIEDEFKISIPDENIKNLNTLTDYAKYIQKYETPSVVDEK